MMFFSFRPPFQVVFRPEYQCTDRKKIAPQMHIQTVLFIIHGDWLSITDNSRQNADNMLIRNAVFLLPSIVTAYDVIIFADFQNTVQNVLPRISFIQRNIIFFQSAVYFLNDKQIAVLSDYRHHTVTDVCIDKFSRACNFFLKS